ncbi:hypothetical protein L484_001365 [Morus notabilis]|uniref:Uncharacterized protein n=1 Tax=Morus notabilis TaxID=981085 RepID=W9SNP0_9ROSA|nr:hypothetical protein L484_001365 [Morus notabilis]
MPNPALLRPTPRLHIVSSLRPLRNAMGNCTPHKSLHQLPRTMLNLSKIQWIVGPVHFTDSSFAAVNAIRCNHI